MIIDLDKEKKRRREHIPDHLQKEFKFAKRFRKRLAKEISVNLFHAKTRGLSDDQYKTVMLYEMIHATVHAIGWVFDESGDEPLLEYIAAELRHLRANEKEE